jgi:serine/threonine protein kinase
MAKPRSSYLKIDHRNDINKNNEQIVRAMSAKSSCDDDSSSSFYTAESVASEDTSQSGTVDPASSANPRVTISLLDQPAHSSPPDLSKAMLLDISQSSSIYVVYSGAGKSKYIYKHFSSSHTSTYDDEQTQRLIDSIKNEARILAEITALHPEHVACYIDSHMQVSYQLSKLHYECGISMEYLATGLEQYLDSKKYSWKARYQVAFGLVECVAAIHACSIIHGDIKPDNARVDAYTGHVKLIDFGFAHHPTENKPYRIISGTQGFIAPEIILLASSYGFAADIYALSVSIWQLLDPETANEIFDGLDFSPSFFTKPAKKHRARLKQAQKSCGWRHGVDLSQSCSPELAALIKLGWSANPQERPSAQHIKECMEEPEYKKPPASQSRA